MRTGKLQQLEEEEGLIVNVSGLKKIYIGYNKKSSALWHFESHQKIHVSESMEMMYVYVF